MSTTTTQTAEPAAQSWAEFLANTPPEVQAKVSDMAVLEKGSIRWALSEPDIQLHCESDTCNGLRFFGHSSNTVYVSSGGWTNAFIVYSCRNCRRKFKTYAVSVMQKDAEENAGYAYKYGELPTYGPPVPSRVISLIGPDRDYLLRGRRAENRGLGIGAFAYYRRVVENQKGRIVGEIAKVAAKVGAPKETVAVIEAAAKETQFSKAVEQTKAALPEVLLINGYNPLSLLHSALSEGLHEHTDAECLELAQSVRMVLTELAERMGQALKDEAGLKEAVSRLLNRKQRGFEQA